MTNEQLEKERAAFEKWQLSQNKKARLNHCVADYGGGEIYIRYHDDNTDNAWQSWQEAKRQSQQTAWIDVNYRLPEEDGLYLVLIVDYHTGLKRVGSEYYKTESGWLISEFCRVRKNTHWQPLPEPPIGEQL